LQKTTGNIINSHGKRTVKSCSADKVRRAVRKIVRGGWHSGIPVRTCHLPFDARRL